jgi:hypothetical protein
MGGEPGILGSLGWRGMPVRGSVVCGLGEGGIVDGLADGESMPGVRVIGDGVVGPGSGETVPVPGVVSGVGGVGDVTPLPGIVPGMVVPRIVPGDEPGNVPLAPPEVVPAPPGPLPPPVVPPPVCASAGPTLSVAAASTIAA